MNVPSKKVLIGVAAAALAVFALALRHYLSVPAYSTAGNVALVIWAAALLIFFEAVILIRQAKRPFHLGVYTFALIYGALIVILHWSRGGS